MMNSDSTHLSAGPPDTDSQCKHQDPRRSQLYPEMSCIVLQSGAKHADVSTFDNKCNKIFLKNINIVFSKDLNFNFC